MSHILIVAAGGAIGASLRHLTGLAALRFWGPGFPWGTLVVNLVGSFIMGLFIEWLVRRSGASSELRLFIATGILGGFTTFSAFSLDFVTLWERGAVGIATIYALVSVLGAIAALFAAMWMMRAMA